MYRKPEGALRPVAVISASERQLKRSRRSVNRLLPSTFHSCEMRCAEDGCEITTVSSTSPLAATPVDGAVEGPLSAAWSASRPAVGSPTPGAKLTSRFRLSWGPDRKHSNTWVAAARRAPRASRTAAARLLAAAVAAFMRRHRSICSFDVALARFSFWGSPDTAEGSPCPLTSPDPCAAPYASDPALCTAVDVSANGEVAAVAVGARASVTLVVARDCAPPSGTFSGAQPATALLTGANGNGFSPSAAGSPRADGRICWKGPPAPQPPEVWMGRSAFEPSEASHVASTTDSAG
mmetsp:Transcript_11371/g.34172  ORF Transcript_11371/g.34172 Transcript_11371/m.34172 type:complete len:293 (-) Transcript_11371:1164-2042(-)